MQWLLKNRVGILPIQSDSVNDAVAKGVVAKVGDIGFELEPDKPEVLPITFTWEAMKMYKLVKMPKAG